MKKFFYLLFFFCMVLGMQAHAQSSADLKRKKEALTREIEELNRTLNKTSSSKKLSLKQILLKTISLYKKIKTELLDCVV